MGHHRDQVVDRFLSAGRRGIAAAEAAEREHRDRGDEGYAELARKAAELMRGRVDLIERGDVSREDFDAASGVGRFLGEYEWTDLDESFLDAMDDAIRLWGPALEALRPEWGPRDDRGVVSS